MPLPPGVETEGPSLLLFDGEDPAKTRVRISREAPNKKWMPHGYLATDEASQEKIMELFGGGRWIAQCVTSPAEGKSLIVGTKMFELPGAYRAPTELPGVGPRQEIGTLRPVQPGPGVAEVERFARMAAGSLSPNEMLNQALVSQVLDVVKVTREGRGAVGGIDWTPIITAGLGALTAFIERGSRPDHSLQDQLRELRDQLNGIRTQPGPAASSMKDIVEALKGLGEVRAAVAGPGAEPVERDPMDKMLELGQTIIQAMASAKREAPAPAPQRALNPGEQPMPRREPVPAAAPAPAIPMYQQMLRDNAPRLVDGARRGLDPAFMAEMAATYMPSEMVGVAREFLTRPDHAVIAVQEIPELAEFPAFNETFWKEFKANLFGEEEPDVAS